jgi:hypothetical protein
MRYIAFFAALLGTAVARPLAASSNGFTEVNPGWIDDIVITKENTLNGTFAPTDPGDIVSAQAAQLAMSFVNNFSGGSINAYVSGLDVNGRVVFLSPSNTWVYPSAGGSSTPVPITDNIALPLPGQGGTLNVVLPDWVTSGRVWFAVGSLQFFMVAIPNGEGLVTPSHVNPLDPSAGVNWGFVELSNVANGGVWANISYVDFVGLVLGMKLTSTDGIEQTVPGLLAGSLQNVCNDLNTQSASDGYPWSKMCYTNNGVPMRALSPNNYYDLDSAGFASYWQSYVDQVWAKYASTPLTISTGSTNVQCTVSGDSMTCTGDNRAYAKPAQKDIWGCNSGTFAIIDSDNSIHRAVVPVLCAAFVRSTLLLSGGNIQPSLPSSSYYTVNPTNHYSRLVHKYLRNGLGYAFSYDDVNPTGENAAGLITSGNPDRLTIYVGGAP